MCRHALTHKFGPQGHEAVREHGRCKRICIFVLSCTIYRYSDTSVCGVWSTCQPVDICTSFHRLALARGCSPVHVMGPKDVTSRGCFVSVPNSD